MNRFTINNTLSKIRKPIFDVALAFVPLAAYLICAAYDADIYFYIIAFGFSVLFLAYIKIESAILLLPLVFANPYGATEEMFLGNIANYTLLVILFAWALRIFAKREKIELSMYYLLPPIILIVMFIVSLSQTRYMTHSITEILRYITYFIFLFTLFYNYTKTPQRIINVITVSIIGGLIASIIGLIQFIEESYRYEVVGRIFGWLGGSYGAVIGSTFMLCLAVLLYEQRLGLRLLSIITLPIVSLALILSQTRAWIGAVAIASFLMLFWTHRQLFIKAVIILGASIIFLFFVYQTDIANTVIKNQISYAFESAFRFGSEGQRATTDVSLWMRLNVLNIAFNLFLQHPITGIGVGNLRFDEHIIGKLGAPAVGVGFVDNQYIQFFTEAGFIAGIVFLLLVFRILKTGFTAVKFSKATPLYSSAFGLLAVLFVFLIGGFFWVVTSDHESFALMIMFIATQANIARLSTPQNLESSDLDRM